MNRAIYFKYILYKFIEGKEKKKKQAIIFS
jgi:hypothetical protein